MRMSLSQGVATMEKQELKKEILELAKPHWVPISRNLGRWVRTTEAMRELVREGLVDNQKKRIDGKVVWCVRLKQKAEPIFHPTLGMSKVTHKVWGTTVSTLEARHWWVVTTGPLIADTDMDWIFAALKKAGIRAPWVGVGREENRWVIDLPQREAEKLGKKIPTSDNI